MAEGPFFPVLLALSRERAGRGVYYYSPELALLPVLGDQAQGIESEEPGDRNSSRSQRVRFQRDAFAEFIFFL